MDQPKQTREQLAELSMWGMFKLFLASTVGIVITTSVSVQKTIELYENEVDNLSIEQRDRLNQYKTDRDAKLALQQSAE